MTIDFAFPRSESNSIWKETIIVTDLNLRARLFAPQPLYIPSFLYAFLILFNMALGPYSLMSSILLPLAHIPRFRSVFSSLGGFAELGLIATHWCLFFIVNTVIIIYFSKSGRNRTADAMPKRQADTLTKGSD